MNEKTVFKKNVPIPPRSFDARKGCSKWKDMQPGDYYEVATKDEVLKCYSSLAAYAKIQKPKWVVTGRYKGSHLGVWRIS